MPRTARKRPKTQHLAPDTLSGIQALLGLQCPNGHGRIPLKNRRDAPAICPECKQKAVIPELDQQGEIDWKATRKAARGDE